MLPRRIAGRGAEAAQLSERARSGIELLPELGQIEAEHRWAPLLGSDCGTTHPFHDPTVDLDDQLSRGIATSLEDGAGVRSSFEHHGLDRGWTRRFGAAVMKEIAPRAARALVGDVLSEQVLEPPAVLIQARLKVTPNRSMRVRALVLALDVVVTPDERLELLSAWARQDRHGQSFPCPSGPIIGTDP